MLEHVTANQTRFMAPGLSSDARGVALGRLVAVLLPSLDRVVGLFRGLSERLSLDDVMSALKIFQVKSPLGSREFIVQLPVSGSHGADSLASVAALMGGLTFTGSAKHFVKYRDSRSPLGYDVDSLYAGQGEFILYDVDFVQAYDHEREVPFAQLALNLSLQRVRDDALQPGDQALLRVVPGLWRAVVSYLHRNNCACEVAACEGAGGVDGKPARFYLVRCHIQPRMESLVDDTPGMELHRQIGKQVAVQVGFRHPLSLSSCGSIFEEQRFYVFSGSRDCLDIVAAVPTFVTAAALVDLGQVKEPRQEHASARPLTETVAIPLKLAVTSGPRLPVAASRVPLHQAEWLKKLVYLLPPQVLGRCTVCITEEAIYLYGGAAIEYVPLGEMFHEVAPGVLVPLGYELVPRVAPDVLVQHLGGGVEQLFFFQTDAPAPLQLLRAGFRPLSRRILAQVEVQALEPAPLPEDVSRETSIQNEPLGLFPLWGFADRAKE
jgi:hypothetical protein